MKKDFNFLHCLTIVLAGGVVFTLMLWITPYGSGVSPDSIVYIETAKSLLAGKGDVARGITVTHYPPLYPIFLATMGFFVSDLIQAARILNALIFSANTFLIGFAVYIITNRNFIATSLATLAFFFSASILMIHSMAWSEPLFILFSLSSIISLALYIKKAKIILLIISSTFLGFAVMTRYIGIALLPAALLIVFWRGINDRLIKQFQEAVIVLLFACGPLGGLLTMNALLVGSATNRHLVYHPVSISHIKAFIDVLYIYFLPIILPFWVREIIVVSLLVFLASGVIIILKQNFEGMIWSSLSMILAVSSFLFFISYLFFLFISISFFDAYTPIDARLLAPAFVFLIIAIWGAAWNLSRIRKKTRIWRYFIFLIYLSIAIKIPVAINSAADIQRNGQGYTSRSWQNSESIAFIKFLPEDVRIYSNGSDVIGFITEKASVPIPAKIFTSTLKTNSHYKEEIAAMCKDIKNNKALFVYFTTIDWRWYLPTPEEVTSVCKLSILHRFADGIVYGGE